MDRLDIDQLTLMCMYLVLVCFFFSVFFFLSSRFFSVISKLLLFSLSFFVEAADEAPLSVSLFSQRRAPIQVFILSFSDVDKNNKTTCKLHYDDDDVDKVLLFCPDDIINRKKKK